MVGNLMVTVDQVLSVERSFLSAGGNAPHFYGC